MSIGFSSLFLSSNVKYIPGSVIVCISRVVGVVNSICRIGSNSIVGCVIGCVVGCLIGFNSGFLSISDSYDDTPVGVCMLGVDMLDGASLNDIYCVGVFAGSPSAIENYYILSLINTHAMATGYSTQIIAEARQRLRDLVGALDDIYNLVNRMRTSADYHQDTVSMQSSGRLLIEALNKDVSIFINFLESSRDSLFDDEYVYYYTMISAISAQLTALETSIASPTIDVSAPIGLENDTEVGASFSAHVVDVADGDTLIVTGRVRDTDTEDKTVSVRVAGIDAPESGTDRGKYVLSVTKDRWLNRDVTVFYDRHTPNDDYGRVLGTIYDGDVNFAIWSLSNCLSEPNLKFGKNHFVDPVQIKQASKKCLYGWPVIGIVKIISNPTHATLYVGKESDESLSIADGITPCELSLPVGRYKILLTVPGYSSLTDVIEVLPIERQLPIYVLQKLESQVASLHVEVPPIGGHFSVFINGVFTGIAPITVDLPTSDPVLVTIEDRYGNRTEEYVSLVLGEITNLVLIPEKAS